MMNRGSSVSSPSQSIPSGLVSFTESQESVYADVRSDEAATNGQAGAIELSQNSGLARPPKRAKPNPRFASTQGQQQTVGVPRFLHDDEPARSTLPKIMSLNDFKKLPAGDMYFIAGHSHDILGTMIPCAPAHVLEGPPSLYGKDYRGTWVFDAGNSPKHITPDQSIITYRPDWLIDEMTVSHLRHFGEVSICHVSMAKGYDSKGDYRQAYKLSTAANEDVALAHIMVEASNGISTIFVCARMLLKDRKNFSGKAKEIGLMTVEGQGNSFYIF